MASTDTAPFIIIFLSFIWQRLNNQENDQLQLSVEQAVQYQSKLSSECYSNITYIPGYFNLNWHWQ